MAQISLRFSTNDVNGTVMEQKIYHGGRSDQAAMHAPAGLARLVRMAGCQLTTRSDDTFTIRSLGPARLAAMERAPDQPGRVMAETARAR